MVTQSSSILFQDELRIDELIRSKRRTIGLEVTDDARLIVRAPLRANLYFIHQAVLEKRQWILRKQQLAKNQLEQNKPKQFMTGEKFLYLGKEYPFHLYEGKQLYFNEGFYLPSKHQPKAANYLQDWYQQQAYRYITSRVNTYAVLENLIYKKIKITNPKSQWASCNKEGNLCFSWRLMMAPVGVIDYIVVHELAHLKHLNHSKRFWNMVGRLYPDYFSHKQWLKNFGHLLNF